MSETDSTIANSAIGQFARDAWKWVIGLGVVQVLFGLLAAAWPGVTVAILGFLLGIYLVLSGIMLIVGAFGPDVPGYVRALYVIGGIISIPLGVTCLRDELQSIVFLAVWVGVAWIFVGAARLIGSIDAVPGTPGRGLAALSGGILVIGGIVLIVSPITSVVTLALVSGIFLIVAGIVHVVAGFGMRRTVTT